MKYEYDFTTISKLAAWAESLRDDVDFIDYWYHLSLSSTKAKIEESVANNINAFFWTRWQEDFEDYFDQYLPIPGNGYSRDIRYWFAYAMQCVVYGFQLSSREIALFYGKSGYKAILDQWFKYHTFSIDLFIDHLTIELGMPDGASRLRLGL